MENAITSVVTRTQHSVLSTQHLLPLPELPINVRLATMDDISFIDGLQKKNNKSLGFMNRPTLEGKIAREEILIAESAECWVLSAEKNTGDSSPLSTQHSGLSTKLGYLIGNDRYFKRDELGAIFQLCVEPGRRRGLVGATLLKALFERASYGCKLYCCWCAQDLEANHFWEAMGFVPVAFRTGSRNKNKRADKKKSARIHIFWQKRIRAGDTETPYWYPSQTGGGAIQEDRIVLPIDPRMHWSEVKLEVLPGDESAECCVLSAEGEQKLLSTQDSAPSTKAKRVRVKKEKVPEPVKPVGTTRALFFGPPPSSPTKKSSESKREKPPKVKQKNDPVKVKAARELRDRYMEQINQHSVLTSNGKYDVSRMIEAVPVMDKALPVQLDQKLLVA